MDERFSISKLLRYMETFIVRPSIVHDNLHGLKKFDKSIFFTFFKISLFVSVFMTLFISLLGDINTVLIFAIVGFFGTFAVLIIICFIERLIDVILNKRKRKKHLEDEEI